MVRKRLAVGRIGDHIGRSKGEAFAVDSVLAEDLLDPKSTKTLIGCPVTVNHLPMEVGKIESVEEFLDNGVLHCWGEVDDQDMLDYLNLCEKENITLETSPEFTCDIVHDDFGRRIQKNRVYTALSILTQDVAGRGGSDVRVKYKWSLLNMEEVNAKLDALIDAVKVLTGGISEFIKGQEKKEKSEEDNSEYTKGFKEGQQMAAVSYSLLEATKTRKVDFKKGTTLEEILNNNLPNLGVNIEGKSLEYKLAALDLLPASPLVKGEGKATSNGQSQDNGPLKVAFGKKRA